MGDWTEAGNQLHHAFRNILFDKARGDRWFWLVTPALPPFLLDINECVMGEHNCRLGESCVNTVGSFRCQRDSSCGTGYELTEDNDCKGMTCSGSAHLSSPRLDRMCW